MHNIRLYNMCAWPRFVSVFALLLFGAPWGFSQYEVKFFADPDLEVGIIEHVNSWDTEVKICADVENDGTINIGDFKNLHFSGTNWTSTPTSKVSGNGFLVFQSDACNPTVEQTLDGGGCDNSTIDRIELNNTNNVRLVGSSLRVASVFKMGLGHLLLDQQNICFNDTTGVVGFCENSYIVTSSTSSTSGLIKRTVNPGPPQTFPVGTMLGDYTPVRIINNGMPKEFSVRVLDGVYTEGLTGSLRDRQTVNKTWEIKEDSPGGANVVLLLQYNETSEGSDFLRADSYIARYVGTVGNTDGGEVSDSKWDYGSALCLPTNNGNSSCVGSSFSAPVASYEKARVGLTDFTNYTLYTIANCAKTALPVEMLYFDGKIQKDCSVHFEWATATEINSSHFEVEHSVDGVDFTKIGEVKSAGDSESREVYYFDYPKVELSNYYRLKIVDKDDSYRYSNVVILHNECFEGSEIVNVYPNPAPPNLGEINIDYFSSENTTASIIILNLLGQVVYKQDVNVMDGINRLKANTEGLEGAHYMIYIKTESYISSMKKVAIEQ